MTNYLDEVDNLLASSPLILVDVRNVYHSLLLDNALHTITNSMPNKFSKYVEEFIANCIYLLELNEEPDARTQLDAAKHILEHIR